MVHVNDKEWEEVGRSEWSELREWRPKFGAYVIDRNKPP
jgi:hypothetical protein